MASPSAYDTSQIKKYEEYVSLPSKYRQERKLERSLSYLTALHVHQISRIPYENLSLHYSSTHTISLDPQALFQKIIGDARGRGGYCMELAIFFHHVLRALGFDVYLAGVRIRARDDGVPKGDYIGWVHVINIVTLKDGNRYHVDVGFGGDGATRPLPLVENHTTTNLGMQEVRLVRDFIPTQTVRKHDSQKLWLYQYRNGPEMEWNSFYAFPETEFLPADLEISNFERSHSFVDNNFQTKRVLVVLFLRGQVRAMEEVGYADADGIVGKVMLIDGVVKQNYEGRTKVLYECSSEGYRIGALKEWFGIHLTGDEIQAIKGRNVELEERFCHGT